MQVMQKLCNILYYADNVNKLKDKSYQVNSVFTPPSPQKIRNKEKKQKVAQEFWE